MIKRDKFKIIVQHNADYLDQADGGDSAARTGIMALAGSTLDRDLLGEFVTEHLELVRHLHQERWDDQKLTSRDQLIQWSAGVSTISEHRTHSTIYNYIERWFINKDLLPPDVKLYLYKCIKQSPPLWLTTIGYLNMFLSLLWTCFVVPDKETNQMICLCGVYGKWWLKKLHDWHPGLEQSLITYWGGYPWRNQIEIKDVIWAYIQMRINEN